jgi:hypothetical protein
MGRRPKDCPSVCPECGSRLVREVHPPCVTWKSSHVVYRCDGLVENPWNPRGDLIPCGYAWEKSEHPT